MLLPIVRPITSSVHIPITQSLRILAPSIVDAENLAEEWLASSITGIADGLTVPNWAGRLGALTLSQATDLSRPLFRADIGGRPALEFNNNYMKTSAYTCTAAQTVYVLFRVAISPLAAGSMLTQDEAGTSTGRSWHSKLTATGTAQAVSFSNTAGQSDTTATAVSTDTWHVHVNRRSAADIEAFIDASSNGPTAVSAPNIVTQPITVGQRGVLSEPFVGYIAGIRIYKASHDEPTRAAVIAEMTAL